MAVTSSRTRSTGSSSSGGFASSTSSTFSSRSSPFFSNKQQQQQPHHRSASPTRVNLFTSTPLKQQSFRYSIESRSISPNRSIAVSSKPSGGNKIRCMCSPTTHPGSFRCSRHKNVANPHGQGAATTSYPTNSLNMRRSAMTNSLVRIGGVEGEWVRRALTTLIRPSSHQQKRRSAYQPRPSRLSVMSRADDL